MPSDKHIFGFQTLHKCYFIIADGWPIDESIMFAEISTLTTMFLGYVVKDNMINFYIIILNDSHPKSFEGINQL